MPKETRIYTVVPKDSSPARLVEAGSIAAVVHHCAAGLFDISVSSQKEVLEATKAGIELEVAKKAGGAPAAEPPKT